ncbi:uncharacterized protein LOC134827101 [Culicoides brevitarsis]|uniref:uncharacterized protein LOC134827101 n=1 Tax=Culicoides brevitarsis TaxID=469753 RepID=UPI00307B4CC8
MSSIGPLESEQLSNLILKWYEAQKNQSSTKNEGSEIDVINLTWILKALGFKLDFMDFLPETINDKSKEIHIELKCSVSGLVARLNYKLESCVCPKKKDEQTFWEVQGIAPSAKAQVKQENTSSSLLPEMSESCSLVSKAILQNLLKYYKDCVEESGGKVEISEAQKKIKIPEIFASKQTKSDEASVSKPEVPQPEIASQVPNMPEINVEIKAEEPAITEEMQNSPSESFILPICTNTTNIVTSSPNEKFEDHSSRDANVVQALNEARSKINQALLYMKLNVTQDLSMASNSILMTTPKVKGNGYAMGTPGSMKRSATANEITQHRAAAQKAKQASTISRRSSFGIKQSTATPLMGTSALKRSNSMRSDTPRLQKISQKVATGIPTKSTSSLSISNASSLSTSSSSLSSVTSKTSSTTKEPFLKPLPGSKKKIVPKAPSLIERFKMQNPVTPKK